MKVSEVAKLTGVTVRTLHYYDEIGLLKPSKVTEAGYRLYSNADLEILQQIIDNSFIFWNCFFHPCQFRHLQMNVFYSAACNIFLSKYCFLSKDGDHRLLLCLGFL